MMIGIKVKLERKIGRNCRIVANLLGYIHVNLLKILKFMTILLAKVNKYIGISLELDYYASPGSSKQNSHQLICNGTKAVNFTLNRNWQKYTEGVTDRELIKQAINKD